MTDHGTPDMSNLPVWLQLLIAAVGGAAMSIVSVIKVWSSFDKRLQKVENHNLDQHIDARISKDWHDNRGPMLQTRVFSDLDKMQTTITTLGQNVAVLLERDRLNQRLERIISALNKKAMVSEEDQ